MRIHIPADRQRRALSNTIEQMEHDTSMAACDAPHAGTAVAECNDQYESELIFELGDHQQRIIREINDAAADGIIDEHELAQIIRALRALADTIRSLRSHDAAENANHVTALQRSASCRDRLRNVVPELEQMGRSMRDRRNHGQLQIAYGGADHGTGAR